MNTSSKKKKSSSSVIVQNRRARHDYAIEETFEAGLELQGWEVKSLRAGKGQIGEGYIKIFDNQAWLLGAHIAPLNTTSTHVIADPLRTRRLLLHRKQLNTLIGSVERKGYTLVGLDLHWNDRNKAKITVALCRGKKQHDKRAAEKEREADRDIARAVKARR